jgi:hypothetical protein
MNNGTIAINPSFSEGENGSLEVSAVNASPYIEKKIIQGETVLSIIEQLHKEQIPVSIEQIITDFERLNPKDKADSIKVGKTYKFPLYEKEVAS